MKKTLVKLVTVMLASFVLFTGISAETAYAKSSDLCAKTGCNNKKYCGSYCATHDCCKIKSSCKTANYGGRKICKKSDCGNTATYSDGYCGRHTSSKSSNTSSYSTGKSYGKSSSAYKKSSSSKKKSYSMPDCDNYEDFDDFMDDWDGCMPDGSDAEDYWDNW